MCGISLQRGQGAPAREPLITEEQQKQMMLHYHRRQEELKVNPETVALHRWIVLPLCNIWLTVPFFSVLSVYIFLCVSFFPKQCVSLVVETG